ncbi:TonB-dependent receptor [Pedobacter xixiisoli]|uniref:Outer membrane receptor for ferrienterochelin and colicins n=1 Tax=Pedobacter xixiisoli TaxID=1476464 RepID=A0A285ZNP2_9SPHI|nr:TonB-dependent receptor [Pedobacter xixiisoli]SOD11273.1 outer membrane receptor for ferrienterochelin and colicins [Pedobacter xixiisoli]
MKNILLIFGLLCLLMNSFAQEIVLKGKVESNGIAVPKVNLRLVELQRSTQSNVEGEFGFTALKAGSYQIRITAIGYKPQVSKIDISSDTVLIFSLVEQKEDLKEVVITGTQKEVNRLESPVPVEIYTAKFFQKNPTPSIFDALQNINGVRPQLNCNICNTGDIHINGLEGPYTMVMIDGMPIVSSLSTVYGLSGIPNSLVERVEVVKGPASSLYGSEAVGGLINIITKDVNKAPSLSADFMTTSYLEHNLDLGFKAKIHPKVNVLTGINYFKYGNKVDYNHDNFTDVTLQDRISVFQKWNFSRKEKRLFSLAGRFLYEDRWGGEMKWSKQYRGGDEVYGESIYTKRFELLGNYQLPVKEKMFFSFSLTSHNQDSRYGTTSYIARQNIAFSQLTWDKKINNHDLLFGTAFRYTYYDDNTTATFSQVRGNTPENTYLPGLFVQDEIKLAQKHSVLLGMRYDYNSNHGNIFTPRFAYKVNFDETSILRLNAGTGFRVVNIFTEDHAALTGARDVVIENDLKPDKTYNVNLNYLKKLYATNGNIFTFDVSAFYTHFTNRIVADYETNTTQIRYDNLSGYAVSKGLTGNLDVSLNFGLKLNAGITLQDVGLVEEGIKTQQILTEKWMGTWSVSYLINKLNLGIDYTGNIYGPMRLPLLNEFDPRQPYSQVWSLQNIQFTYRGFKNLEVYGGVKNLLNFKPTRNNPFIISRANDPFDKQVQFDANGNAMATPNNPYGLTFDPSYVYAPNQGIRGFFGLRYNLR